MTTTHPQPSIPPTGDFPLTALRRYSERRMRAAEEHAEDDLGNGILLDRWRLPQGSPAMMSIVARLARGVAVLPDPAAILAPASVVLLDADVTEDTLYGGLLMREVMPSLAHLHDRPMPQVELVTVRDWSELDSVSASSLSHDLVKVLSRGATAIVPLDPGTETPAVLGGIRATGRIRVPTLAAVDIAAMLAACERSGWDDADVAERLSRIGPLHLLRPLHLVHAWHAPEAEDAAGIVRRLADATAWAATRPSDDAAPDEAERDAPDLRLADLHGLDAAAPVLRRIVDDVRDWQAGRLDWRDVGASVLLAGPPGCGKTSAAAAIAGEIGGPVIDLSYTQLQAAGHLGQMLAALDEGVARAKASTPCVVLVDEADDLGDRSGGDASARNSRYMRSVVNAYLTRLSKVAATPGVVVVLATNNPSLLDPALVRAGRVDHHVHLALPDRAAMAAILTDGLRGQVTPGLDRTPAWFAALDALAGGSGADAARLAREAIAAARDRARHDLETPRSDIRITAADLERAARRDDRRTVLTDRRRVAIHEAGHLVAGHLLRLPAPTRAWVGPRSAGVSAPAVTSYTLSTARAELAALLAGREAERLVLGSISSGAGAGAASDLAKATLLAAEVATEWHLEEAGDSAPVWRSAERTVAAPDWTDRRTAGAIGRLLADARDTAATVLREHRAIVERMAGALLRERDLDGDAIALLLADPAGQDPAAEAVGAEAHHRDREPTAPPP
ncbi:AAA family ATPase [Jannaschia formosa]|uniref:AAA family ATPase n=1 Tax=Jannaschia formosa TaxID=2259592 RepID=UPI001074B02D|nr:AAA family ATPase [Jannaschia formosa]TFL16138.1 AAA family ATPase [Jannaschia formosa]